MWVKVFVLCAFSVGSLYSDNDSKCDITGIPSVDWVLGYESNMNDNEINKRIFNGTYTGKLDNLKCSCTIDNPNSVCKETYFQATLDTKTTQFLVETTDALKNFDEDINTILSKPQPSLLLFYKCNMTCQNPTTPSLLPFAITVKDYNDFRPDFSTGDTVYKVSSPIMKEADFSVYGAEIYATDKDFGNEDITFKIDPDDFDIVKTITDDKPRKFKVNFKANKVLQLTQDKKYTITATDSGKIPGPLSSTLQVTLKVDPDNVVDYPNFEYTSKSYEYAFRYEKNHTLTTINGPIKVTTNKPSDLEKSISLSGDLSGNFGATFDTSSSTIKVSIKTNIDNPTSAFVVLSLNVQTDAKVSAPVVIYFANAPKDDTPKFNQHLYTGKYDDSTNKISLDQDITVSSTSALSTSSFKITGDFSGNFEIKLDDDKKSYLLDVNKALTPTEIKSKEYLSLTIEVTVDSKSDTTGVIVYLPEHTLEFKEVLYTATYFENNTIAASTISFASDVTNSKVSVKVEDTYSKNFEVKPTSKGDYALGLISNLPDAVLQTQTEISIVLTASDKYDNQARSVVKMALPQQKAVEAPKFSQLAYKIKYNEGQKSGVLDFDTPPSFVNYADPSAIKIDLKTYAKYFTVAFDSTTKKFGVKVLQALDSSFLKNNELVETMVAVKTNVAAKGNAVLVVELVKLKPGSPPTFEKPSYTAVYKKGLKVNDYIDFDQVVSLKNVVNLKNVAIKLDSNEANFKVLLESNKWRIQLLKPIDDDTFSKINDIVITMEVSESGISGQSIGVLVINLSDPSKDDKAPNFEKPFYTVQYNTTAKYMDFEPAIKFTNVDVGSVQMTLSDYSKYFELDLDATKKVWRIKVIAPLDDAILKHNAELHTTMEATEMGVTGVGVLIIQIPINNSQDKAPEFSDLYYKVVYKQGQTGFLDFTNDIAFNNVPDISIVDINLYTYMDNFKLVYNNKKWRILIDRALDDKVFATSTTLVDTMEASLPDVIPAGDVVLMIDLVANVPQFGNDYYTAAYPVGGSGIFYFDNDLDFKNVDPKDVQLYLDNYYGNFNITYNSVAKKWQIDIKTPLDDSVISKNEYLVTKLTAKIVSIGSELTATVVLKLPKKQAPVFSKTSFKAEYTIQKNHPVVTFTDSIGFKNKPNMANINIVSDDFSGYFTFKYSTNSWQMIVDKPLDSTNLYKTNLVVTITAIDITDMLQAHSTIDLKLPPADTKDAPKFEKSYYKGRYEVVKDVGKVILDEDIHFSNKVGHTDIGIIPDSGYNQFFEFSLDLQSKWTVLVKKPLNASILSSGNDIIMQLVANELGIKDVGKSTLLLTLPKINDDQAPKFDHISYRSLCSANTTKLDIEIKVTNRKKEDLKNIVVAIQEDEYSDNFDVKFDAATSSWYVEVKSTPKTMGDKNNLVLTLSATESNNKTEVGLAGLVIEFPVFIAPEFSANPYVGTYNVADGTLKIIDFNVVNKDQSKLKLSFSSKDGDFSKYLSVNYDKADKNWKMLLTNPIDKLTVTNNDEIVLTITAKENDNPKQGETTAIIKIIDESKNKNDIQFSRAHYSASYRIVDNTPVVKLNEYIRVTSTKDVTKATVRIQSASDFEPVKYFKIAKKTDHFEIVAREPLTIDILRKFTNLIVTLMVELENTKNYATLIIDLSAVESGDDIKFNSVVYMGTYENRNNVNKITCDPINVITTSPENIFVSITNAYKEYFSLTYNAKDSSVALNLAKSIPASVIEDFSTVAVVVQAMNGLSHKIANAVINLRIISDDTPVKNGVVLFNKISNTAKYLQGSFTLDNSIGLTTDRKEDEIKASIEDSAFSKYFTAYYKNQEVTVKLTREIPQENITSKPFITLTLVASIVNTNETSKASLTVQLDNDHHETLKATKYIVSISLLAVLIVLLILAAVAFYYLRLRKKNEAKMTEDEYIEKREVRFESTSRPSDKSSRSSAIEGRRPTGFIFKRQDEDEDEDESSTDGSAKERKKSVVFDEVVEKLKMEDEVEKPDIDD
ncbi:unnamed protein product [Phyllotreta striolata]|uniref:Cadherin domain-containing protein n=1 Tax=Phyllotreta striolata TaxID=444603 RepID=A0A9P0GYR5_PHYSR|nr:unnamed protein product [Phyllotreta striolata]